MTLQTHMRLFTIRSYGDDFLTGETDDGRRVLMGLLAPNLVAVFFDPDGRYVSCETRELTMLPPRMGATGVLWETADGTESVSGVRPGPFQLSDPAFRTSFSNDLDRLKRDIGFTKGPIHVQQFDVDGDSVGIDLLPEHLAEFKENPTAVAHNDEEQGRLRKSLADWETAGSFVLWWAKDYWCSADGEVEST